MAKKKVTRTAVNQQQTKNEAPSPLEVLGFLTPSDEAGFIGDLVSAAQGAALLLAAAQSHVEGDDWDTVAAGVSVVLATVANQVDARRFQDLGISLQSHAIDPQYRLYLLEKQAAELRAKIAEKQRRRS